MNLYSRSVYPAGAGPGLGSITIDKVAKRSEKATTPLALLAVFAAARLCTNTLKHTLNTNTKHTLFR